MQFKSRYSANSTGDVTYGRNVLTDIVTHAAQEITGVAKLSGRGVKFDLIGKTLNVDVDLDVMYGVSCADVAFRVQENIKRSAETMTAYKVDVVNVNILGLSMNT